MAVASQKCQHRRRRVGRWLPISGVEAVIVKDVVKDGEGGGFFDRF